MSKKRRRPEHSILSKLKEVDSLIAHKRWVEARDLLESLDARFPNREDVLSGLGNVYAELDDMPRYQQICEQLLKLAPDDPEYILAFAGACMGNIRPASAVIAFHRFLDRHPQHERAAEVRKTVEGLESRLDEFFRDAGFAGADAFESAALHEQSLALIDQGKFSQARLKAEELLKRHSNFVPALNNVGQAYFAEGQLDRAIEFAERALTLDDDNFHALGNLTRYYCLLGKMDQAQSCLARLERVESKAADVWLKKMEAASTLGADRAVMEAFDAAERAGIESPH
ncbi:MAG: tetratricopeptide repeat protein [Chloroflexi bacterium]|nr:tetratricopeptide repeat protein [Chloroflexota bacterium]